MHETTPDGPTAEEAPAAARAAQLQQTLGNRALSRAIGARVLQRTVSGIANLEQLKADAQAWNTFLLLDRATQGQFQDDVGDTTKDVSLVGHYVPLAKVSGAPVLRDWYGANIATIAATAPGSIEIGLQDDSEEEYDFPNLLRFRWFGVTGPVGPRGSGARVKIAVLGLNLHRGPKYSGLGHGWGKIGDDLAFEFSQNIITTSKSAIVTLLEQHAAGSHKAGVRQLANNVNCVKPTTTV